MTTDTDQPARSSRPGAGRSRWLLACLVALPLLVAASCDDRAGDPGNGATVPEEATTTSTTAPADPYAVPDVIDTAYVDRVLAALYKVDGDAGRIIVREGEIVPDAANTLRAIYGRDALSDQLDQWGESVGDRFRGLRSPPGDIKATVTALRSAKPTCVFAAVLMDFSGTAAVASDPIPTYIALFQKEPAEDPANVNPTPWAIGLNAFSINGAPPEDPCPGR